MPLGTKQASAPSPFDHEFRCRNVHAAVPPCDLPVRQKIS
jgi:hypothetical protein